MANMSSERKRAGGGKSEREIDGRAKPNVEVSIGTCRRLILPGTNIDTIQTLIPAAPQSENWSASASQHEPNVYAHRACCNH